MSPVPRAVPRPIPVTAADLAAMRDRVAAGDVDRLSPAEIVDLLRAGEELVAAVHGLQAVATARFAAAEARPADAFGEEARARTRRVVAAQVGLARRMSLHRGTSAVVLAERLTTDMPQTLRLLRVGTISEFKARLICRETDFLSPELRAEVDAELCADPATIDGWGDRRVANEARRLAQRIDPHAAVRRISMAEADRCVTIRPEPDCMVRISAVLPVADGVRVFGVLHRAATRRAPNDPRSKNQVMADELVHAVTGQPPTSAVEADSDPRRGAGTGKAAPVLINLVMTDQTLLARDDEPAHLDGYGSIPAIWARKLIADHLQRADVDDQTQVLVRRLFTAAHSGDLVAMESRTRRVPAGLAALVRLRDQTCRIGYCDAPIAHIDHLTRWADGGKTRFQDLGGVCEAHNYVHEHADWQHRHRPGRPPPEPRTRRPRYSRRHRIDVITPTGHTYMSIAPALPGSTS